MGGGAARPHALLEQAHEVGDTTAGSLGPLTIQLRSRDPELVAATAQRLALTTPGAGRWGALSVALIDDGGGARPPIPPPSADAAQAQLLSVTESLVTYSREGTLWIIDLHHGRALRWAPEPEAVTLWERLAPLRIALHWWSIANGGAMLHAGAVAGPAGAALLVGPPGAGKSTASMACLGSDLGVLGDDYVLLDTAGGCTISAVYASGKLDEGSLELLPHLRDRVIGAGLRGKSLVRFEAPPPAPLRAVCAVEQAPGARTVLREVGRGEVLRRLAPSTIRQVAGGGQELLRVATDAVRSSATYVLTVGHPREVPTVLGEMLAGTAPT